MLFNKPSLTTRVAVGKLIGSVFGLAGLILLPLFIPEASWKLRIGILLWYSTVGAMIGLIGVFTTHPVLHLPLPWWARAPIVGAWMNFVLSLFAYDIFKTMFATWPGTGSPFFWLTLEGAIVGLVIGYLATRLGGEGKATVTKDP